LRGADKKKNHKVVMKLAWQKRPMGTWGKKRREKSSKVAVKGNIDVTKTGNKKVRKKKIVRNVTPATSKADKAKGRDQGSLQKPRVKVGWRGAPQKEQGAWRGE